MRLLGSETSPYVRRVRIVALELGVPHTLVSINTPEGEAELRRTSPLWKIPTAVLEDGRALWDSHAIVDWLLAHHGPGPLRAREGAERWAESNLVHAIDGGLDAAVNVMYLERDGVPASAAKYLQKQVDRTARALAWVEAQLHGASFFTGAAAGFGLAELALVTALGWMRFRERFPVQQHRALMDFLAAHEGRPSVQQTAPRLG